MTITLRLIKGLPLTYGELDGNFTDLVARVDAHDEDLLDLETAVDAVELTLAGLDAQALDYDNTASGLVGDTVQEAIDELAGSLESDNPMIATGDMIRGGALGVPTRLPIGTNGQALKVVAGLPAWQPDVAATATALATARNFQASGDATSLAVSFDGTANVSLALTLATVNADVGTYGGAGDALTVSVDGKGRVTSMSETPIALAASQVASGTFDNARISQANVTQHQAALLLAATQINSGTFDNARISQGNVTQHQSALALAATQLTSGSIPNARVPASNVTQHQAALTILETQITDGTLLARLAANETVAGNWTFSNPVVGATPSSANHLVTKEYVDLLTQGLRTKEAVRAMATGNLNIASPGATIDGVTMVAGDRVLLVFQSTASQNGAYIWNGAAVPMTRASDFDTSGEVLPGSTFFTSEGTAYNDTVWTLITDNPIVLGTTALTFTQTLTLADLVAGTGMVKSGSTINVQTASAARIVVNADNIDLATLADGGGGTFLKFTRDSYGRVSGTSAVAAGDITALVNASYVKLTGNESVAGEKNFTNNMGLGKTPETTLDIKAADNVTTTYPLWIQNSSENYGTGYGAYGLTNRNIGGAATNIDYTMDIGGDLFFRTSNNTRLTIAETGLVTASVGFSGPVTTDLLTLPGSALMGGPNAFVRKYAGGFGATLTATSLYELGRVVTPSNSNNISIKGRLVSTSGHNSGITNFTLNIRSNTLPSKNYTFMMEREDMTGNVPVEVYNNTASGETVIAFRPDTAFLNTAWEITAIERGNYDSFTDVAAATIFDPTGYTAVLPTATNTYIYSTNKYRTIDGTVALPAWGFTSDADTGIYRFGENQIGFAAGGLVTAQVNVNGLRVGNNMTSLFSNMNITYLDSAVWDGYATIALTGSAGPTAIAGDLILKGRSDLGRAVEIWTGTTPARKLRVPDTGVITTTVGITVTGEVSATSFNTTSTRRVKANVKNLNLSYLEKFNALRPREYDHKLTEKHDIGFVAEEVIKVLPELVGVDEKGRATGLDYGRISTVLTAVVQDQGKTLKKQASEIKKLQVQLNGLKKSPAKRKV